MNTRFSWIFFFFWSPECWESHVTAFQFPNCLPHRKGGLTLGLLVDKCRSLYSNLRVNYFYWSPKNRINYRHHLEIKTVLFTIWPSTTFFWLLKMVYMTRVLYTTINIKLTVLHSFFTIQMLCVSSSGFATIYR